MEREKLIELLIESEKEVYWVCHERYAIEKQADRLIANGVVVRDKGEWDIRIDDYDCEYMVCSVCNTDFFDGANDTVDYKPDFCPVCGSDMRGDR